MSNGNTVVGAILLAAGESDRFGEENKLLATVDGEPIVRQAARTLTSAAVDSAVAIVGHDADRVTDVLEPLDIGIRKNDNYTEGQSTSVRTGIEVAEQNGWDAVLFALGDMPFIDSQSVDKVIREFNQSDETVVAPSYQDTRGNPALFGRRHYDALADVSGDTGGRELVVELGSLVPVADDGVVTDIDRPSDLTG